MGARYDQKLGRDRKWLHFQFQCTATHRGGGVAIYSPVHKVDCYRNRRQSATKSTVAGTVDFVVGFGSKSATTWIRQLVAVDSVADMVDFVASVYGAKATRSILSTFNKDDRVEFNFVASVYRALGFSFRSPAQNDILTAYIASPLNHGLHGSTSCCISQWPK